MLLAVVLLSALMSVSCAQRHANEWQLIWSDEFEGNTLNTSNWKHEVDCWGTCCPYIYLLCIVQHEVTGTQGGGNNELQCFTARPENSFVADGKLTLLAK